MRDARSPVHQPCEYDAAHDGDVHPQADLATEPRWGRISGTLGEDADLAGDLLRAMVRGFQGAALGPTSVRLIVRHFRGKGGQDSHFEYGKFDVYPGDPFDYHVRPFKAAIDAGRGREGRAAGPRGGGTPGGRGGFGDLQTRGEPIDLTFSADQLRTLRTMMQARPTVVALYLDRPYVIPEIAREAAALVGHFGVTDAALLDVLTGVAAPSGKLPFEMPSSMDAVRTQKEDVPYDSVTPSFRFGHGLTYSNRGSR